MVLAALVTYVGSMAADVIRNYIALADDGIKDEFEEAWDEATAETEESLLCCWLLLGLSFLLVVLFLFLLAAAGVAVVIVVVVALAFESEDDVLGLTLSFLIVNCIRFGVVGGLL